MRVKTICVMYVIVVCFVLASCCTAKPITDGLVIEHSRQLAVLENGIEEYGESVAEVRANIVSVCEETVAVREGATSISLVAEDTIILFDEYQRVVELLLQDQVTTAYENKSQSLTTLSSSIADNLQYLKTESNNMVNQLQKYELTLQQSAKKLEQVDNERQVLVSQAKALSSHFMSINEQLNDCYKTMVVYETKLQQRMRIIVALLTILIILSIGFVLYVKGIVLPI